MRHRLLCLILKRTLAYVVRISYTYTNELYWTAASRTTHWLVPKMAIEATTKKKCDILIFSEQCNMWKTHLAGGWTKHRNDPTRIRRSLTGMMNVTKLTALIHRQTDRPIIRYVTMGVICLSMYICTTYSNNIVYRLICWPCIHKRQLGWSTACNVNTVVGNILAESSRAFASNGIGHTGVQFWTN